jgi:hypothetical protein
MKDAKSNSHGPLPSPFQHAYQLYRSVVLRQRSQDVREKTEPSFIGVAAPDEAQDGISYWRFKAGSPRRW